MPFLVGIIGARQPERICMVPDGFLARKPKSKRKRSLISPPKPPAGIRGMHGCQPIMLTPIPLTANWKMDKDSVVRILNRLGSVPIVPILARALSLPKSAWAEMNRRALHPLESPI